MKTLDRNLQRRVWARVYGDTPQKLTHRQRENLRRALVRCGENLALFEQLEHHSLYGDAFARLTHETREHTKMLNQMLRG